MSENVDSFFAFSGTYLLFVQPHKQVSASVAAASSFARGYPVRREARG